HASASRDWSSDVCSSDLTLNHLLLVDLLYKSRLEGKGNNFDRLDQELHDDFEALAAAQRESDAWYVDFLSTFGNERLDDAFIFADRKSDLEGQRRGAGGT